MLKSFSALAHSKRQVEALSKSCDSNISTRMSATPCSIYETVKSAFAVNDLAVLQHYWVDLLREIDSISESSHEQLLDAISSTNYSLSRCIGAEIFIPKCVKDQKDKSCTAIR